MPLFSSPKPAPTLSETSFPVYAIKSIGSRHVLVGGGGGASKTGVGNGLELLLLTYNSFPKVGVPNETIRGTKTANINTDKRSVMNMDCISVNRLDSGKYLIAVGEDDFCYFYETMSFAVASGESEVDIPSKLSFNFNPVGRVLSVEGGSKAYQKYVKFDRSNSNVLRAATAGTDGYVRIWNVSDIVQNRDSTIERKPILEILVEKSEISEVDFSPCGSMILAVTKDVHLFNTNSGTKLGTLPDLPQIPKQKFLARSAKFVNFNPQSPRSFLAVAHNMRQSTTKSNCYLSIWAYEPEAKMFKNLELREIKKERIVVTSISADQNYYGVGFASGNTAIYTTRELEQLYFCNAHSNSVTGIEFLPRRTLDTPNMGRIEKKGSQNAQTFLPGVTSESLISAVSISMDRMITVHQVPYPKGFSSMNFLIKSSFWMLLVYLLFWSIIY